MQITNYQLITDAQEVVDLPHLSTPSLVRVWTIPVEYTAQTGTAVVSNGLFISTTDEIPGCDHGEPVFEQTLPAHPGAVLAEVKTRKNAQINEWRLAANQSTFSYMDKTFACDVLSRSDIEGVANTINLKGTFPNGFPNAWKAVDNTYIPINTINDFGNFYQAMSAQGSTNFAHAQALKQTLANATTVEQVEAIAW